MAENTSGVAPQVGAADAAGQQTTGEAQNMGMTAAAGQQMSGQNIPAQNGSATAPDAQGQEAESFASLIAGKYKADYEAAVQNVVKQRLKGHNQLKRQLETLGPVVDALGAMYGIDTSDPRKIDYAAIAEKFGADSRMYDAEAIERGTTAEAVRREYQQKAETASMRRQLQEYQIQEAFGAVRAGFDRDVASRYGADFDTEMANADFARLIAANVPPKTAYEVVHMAEIQQAQAQMVADRARSNVMQTIAAQGARPAEIGGNANGGEFTKTDPRSWTKQQREDIIRRVQRGERIVL